MLDPGGALWNPRISLYIQGRDLTEVTKQVVAGLAHDLGSPDGLSACLSTTTDWAVRESMYSFDNSRYITVVCLLSHPWRPLNLLWNHFISRHVTSWRHLAKAVDIPPWERRAASDDESKFISFKSPSRSPRQGRYVSFVLQVPEGRPANMSAPKAVVISRLLSSFPSLPPPSTCLSSPLGQPAGAPPAILPYASSPDNCFPWDFKLSASYRVSRVTATSLLASPPRPCPIPTHSSCRQRTGVRSRVHS